MNRRMRTRSKAAQAASDLISIYRLSVPIPIEDLARSHGIEIVRTPDLTYQGSPASGLLLHANGRRICAVRANEKHERQRFTIAHELGHFLLGHQGDAIPGGRGFVERVLARNDISRQSIDRREIEANAFAAELLMPAQEVIARVPYELHDTYDQEVIVDLAAEFQVSFTAMTNRLNTLGCLLPSQ